MKLLDMVLVVCMAVLASSNATAADPASSPGAALANACAACHGPDGHSQGAIPSIDNLASEDFTTALKTFRADTRKGTVMNHIARGLDDAEINATAAYFASRRGH